MPGVAHLDFVARMVAVLDRPRRILFACACANRVREVLADYERAPRRNADAALRFLRDSLKTGEFDAVAASGLCMALERDGAFAAAELELPVTYTLGTILSALQCSLENSPDSAVRTAGGALDAAMSTEASGMLALDEETAWQRAALEALVGNRASELDALASLGALPPAWLLRLEGNL